MLAQADGHCRLDVTGEPAGNHQVQYWVSIRWIPGRGDQPSHRHGERSAELGQGRPVPEVRRDPHNRSSKHHQTLHHPHGLNDPRGRSGVPAVRGTGQCRHLEQTAPAQEPAGRRGQPLLPLLHREPRAGGVPSITAGQHPHRHRKHPLREGRPGGDGQRDCNANAEMSSAARRRHACQLSAGSTLRASLPRRPAGETERRTTTSTDDVTQRCQTIMATIYFGLVRL